MRPRFANRGSASGRNANERQERGFNEAPIRESGKWADTVRYPLGMARFNEAPIRESGKYASCSCISMQYHVLQ